MAVELAGITKRFPGVIANDRVDLAVEAGSVHAIVGENGAGKSTLMKTLYGLQSADEGTMAVDGSEVSFRSPKDAIEAGIGMVHQHFMLADNLTVAENVILGSEPTRGGGRIDFAAARERIADLGRTYGLDVDPDTIVEDLGIGERQRVEILKVLYRGARILILDEPTAVLVPQEVDELFHNLEELKAQGQTILFISHKLDEVMAIADDITVIRAGRTVATVQPDAVSPRELAELMVGSELPRPETRDSTVTDHVVLEMAGVEVVADDGRISLAGLDLVVRRGEIVGIAGVEGNGQSELIDAIIGVHPVSQGRIGLEGDDIAQLDTRERREAGIGYIPEDRHRRGLLLSAPLWENTMLGHQTRRPFRKGPWVDRSGAKQRTREIIDEYDVRTPGHDTAAYALSGGNQQKLIIGREMRAEPRVLIAAHPTRGIDVGAQAAVWEELRDARAKGLAVILVSADLDELIGLSDTLVVMLRGRIVAQLDPAELSPDVLGAHMTGAAVEERTT